MFHYLEYLNGVFVEECWADSYNEARVILGFGNIFVVERDGHETECGTAWVNSLFQ